MEEKKPIKRSPHLTTLSREHHVGLQCCWKLREGLTLHVDTDRMRGYLNYFWENHLVEHFRIEEELLYNSSDNALCKEALAEHVKLREMIGHINDRVRTDGDVYDQFAQMLEAHIRLEERQLFPLLESILPADKLAEIGAILAEGHEPVAKDEYPDEFWVNRNK